MENNTDEDYLSREITQLNESKNHASAGISEVEQIKALKNMETNFVFLFGKRTAGKTAILSSLVYCITEGETNGTYEIPQNNSCTEGLLLEKIILEKITNGRFVERSKLGIVTNLNIIYTPTNSKLPSVDVTFLEMSGEDLETVEVTSKLGQLPSNIDIYFKASEIPLLFILVTTWQEASKDDKLIADFLKYIVRKNQDFKKARFLLLITQWDSYHLRDRQNAKEFVEKNMRSTYPLIKNAKNIVSDYSLGRVIIADGEPYIEKFDHSYPISLWKQVYQSFTGIELDKKSWIAKILA